MKELADDFQEAPTLTKGLLTAGAVVGASVLLFSQVRLGSARPSLPCLALPCVFAMHSQKCC